MKAERKFIKDTINVKSNSDVLINNSIILETTTANAKFIPDYFKFFFASASAKLNENSRLKLKKPFPRYFGQTTNETIFLSVKPPADV